MRNILYVGLCLLSVLTYCAKTTQRNPVVVEAEEYERQKPIINPIGGLYYKNVKVKIMNFESGLEYSTGTAFTQLNNPEIFITQTTALKVRQRSNVALWNGEIYEIVDSLLPPTPNLPAGNYAQPFFLVVHDAVKNARVEFAFADDFMPYAAESGIYIAQTTRLRLRQCVETICSAVVELNYSVGAVTDGGPPSADLTAADISGLLQSAALEYNQLSATGLSQRMDEAKALLLQDSSLIGDASIRQRFLRQDNSVSAAEACTIIARYLYVKSRRMVLQLADTTGLPDFPSFYLHHISTGDITVDSTGNNFVWLMNGSALVTSYLPTASLAPFEYARGAEFPTDGSLLAMLDSLKPVASLLRDSSSPSYSSHTFIALRTTTGYVMLDTYFSIFSGIDVRGSAGKDWPYAYRFGPAGSRYLYYVYGY